MVEQETPSPYNDSPNEAGLGITSRQLWQLVLINALISAAISLLVLLIVGPWALRGAVSSIAEMPADVPQPSLGTPLDTTNGVAAAPTPTPVPEPILHQVNPGDSLSLIAQRYNVPMNDIMAANGLQDPDSLQAGQTLLIPVGGLAFATPTFTAVALPTDTALPFDPPPGDANTPVADVSIKPTSTPTPAPTSTAPPVGVVLIEISNVLGYGQLDQETVTIFNQGPGVNLSGWKIEGSRNGNYNSLISFCGMAGACVFIPKQAQIRPVICIGGQDEARWLSGDTVELVDATGEVVASYVIP